jgi:transcriptional regulator with XRE-family HTH domain
MSSFGRALRSARQQQGISLDDVARDTRLSKRYLLALEEESISELPGGAYNRAYVRTYALYLRLDPDSLVRDYALEEEAQTKAGRLAVGSDVLATMRKAAERPRSQPLPKRSGIATVARVGGFVCVAVALLVGLNWVRTRGVTRRNDTVPIGRSSPPSRGVSIGVGVAVDPKEARSTRLEQGTSGLGAVPLPPPAVERPPAAVEKPQVAVEKPKAADAAAPHLLVTGSGVGTDVVDQQLVGRSDMFAVGTRVAFWTHVTGGRPGETIRHVWTHHGRTEGAVDLRVGSASWRTQSRRVLAGGAEGDWIVEARDPEGRVLARHEFRCVP